MYYNSKSFTSADSLYEVGLFIGQKEKMLTESYFINSLPPDSSIVCCVLADLKRSQSKKLISISDRLCLFEYNLDQGVNKESTFDLIKSFVQAPDKVMSHLFVSINSSADNDLEFLEIVKELGETKVKPEKAKKKEKKSKLKKKPIIMTKTVSDIDTTQGLLFLAHSGKSLVVYEISLKKATKVLEATFEQPISLIHVSKQLFTILIASRNKLYRVDETRQL